MTDAVIRRDDQRHDDGYDDTSRWPASRLSVLIRHDGSALLDGEPLQVAEGETVQRAVLDAMQHRAQARGETVEASIFDWRAGESTRVEVAPDGSSRMLEPSEHDPADEPSAPPAVTSPSAGAAPFAGPGPRPRPSAGTPPATAPQSAAPAPLSARVPGELEELVGLVVAALEDGAPERAAAVAFRLRQHAARTFGTEHPHTLEARALEAFVAHRRGDHLAAAATCLDLARTYLRCDASRAHEELTRAVAAWRLVDDAPSAVEQGRALLDVGTALAEQGGARTLADLMDFVGRRTHTLSAASVSCGTGAA